jgi:CBS domain-containing protein
MFTVYGISGREFSGTLEQMREGGLSVVTPASRAHALRKQARQDPHPPAPDAGRDPGDSAYGTLADEANRAYTRTQQGDAPVRHPLTRVSEVMSREAVTVPHTDTVMQGWTLLARRGLGQAPVTDRATGTLVGLLLRADLLPSPDDDAHAWGELLKRPVTTLMVTPVPGVGPDTDLRRVAQVLLDTGLPGLPVTDDRGGVLGFVSRSDILQAVAHDPPLDLWT